MLPNFIIGGGICSGGSFLNDAIRQHPGIYLTPIPAEPESHFFHKSWIYKRTLSYYEEKYFSKVKKEKAIGESCGSYLTGKEVPLRIHKHIPNVKLIFLLRNPIERAYANYRFSVLSGHEEMSFQEALKKEHERIKMLKGKWKEIQPNNYTLRGIYFKYLNTYFSLFCNKNILLVKSENMRKYPQETFKEVFRFLGIEENFTPIVPSDYSSVCVVDRKLQKELRIYFQDRFSKIIASIRHDKYDGLGLNSKEDRIKYQLLLNNLTKAKDRMSEEARIYLREKYIKPNEKLKRFINFDIDDWN